MIEIIVLVVLVNLFLWTVAYKLRQRVCKHDVKYNNENGDTICILCKKNLGTKVK